MSRILRNLHSKIVDRDYRNRKKYITNLVICQEIVRNAPSPEWMHLNQWDNDLSFSN